MIFLARTESATKIINTRYPQQIVLTDKDSLHNKYPPTTIYSIHWSWKIPDEILSKYKVIGFHMTDLPFGGGSYAYERLKGLGFKETMITAFELVSDYDAGPILMKRHVKLEKNKHQTMRRVYEKCCDMVGVLEQEYPMYIKQSWYKYG